MQTRVAEIFHNDGDLLHKSIYKVVLKKTKNIRGEIQHLLLILYVLIVNFVKDVLWKLLKIQRLGRGDK